MKPWETVIDRQRHPRILVWAADGIGQSVMSMPVVQRLRELERQAHIAVACPARLKDLWRRNAFINEVMAFEDKLDPDVLREREFDVAIILPDSFRSAWECYRAGIPCRVGFAGPARRWLLTHTVPVTRGERVRERKVKVDSNVFKINHFPSLRHLSHHYLDLISFVGGNREPVPPRIFLAVEDLPPMTKFFRDDGRPVLGMHAHVESAPAKCWPAERFAALAQAVAEAADCRWLLFGGPEEAEAVATIDHRLREAHLAPNTVINLAGRTNLLELCQLIKVCQLLVTNDTGPMHIASAVGRPVVAIYGSTSPERTGPTGPQDVCVRQPVECSPCFLRKCPIDFRCMQRVSVDQVTQAVLDAIENRGISVNRPDPLPGTPSRRSSSS